MTEKICRLCLQTITKIYQTVEESTLKTLKLNPSVSRQPVICAECANYLEVFSNLKPTRVYMRDGLFPLTGIKSEFKLDPEYETTSNPKSLIETEVKCSFCAKVSGRGSLVPLTDSKGTESLVNLLKQHVPEMNFKNTEELLTCETCLGTLRDLFSFISKCLEVEEKINKFIEVKGTDYKGQIELKDVQQFVFGATVKLEIDPFDDHIQDEYTMEAEAEIKRENEIDNPETIIKLEFVDVASGQIIKTEDDVKSETNINMENVDIKSEAIIKTEAVDITSELIIKTEDVDFKEHSNPERYSCKTDIPKKNYKYCVVPSCRNTTVTAPDKIFISLPGNENRILWQKAMRRVEFLGSKTTKFCCEDHFNLEEDVENYMYFKMMKNVAIRLRPGVVPHIFDCQENRKQAHSSDPLERPVLASETKPGTYKKQHLLDHKNSSEVSTFKCKFCSYQTKHNIYFQSHLLTHKSPIAVPVFKCELCSFRTKQKTYLQFHSLTHKTVSEVPVFKCELCPFQTQRKQYLQKHLVTHKTPSEVSMFECELCPYRAKRKSHLQMHVLTHKSSSDLPMFKCKSCSYEAKHKIYLQKHILTHKSPSEVSMFKCALCSYQTKHKEYLAKHLLTHKSPSEVPMFKCELCSYQTKYKRYLPKHLLSHKTPLEVAMFKCEFCSYRAKHKRYLQMHLLTHKTGSDVPMLKCEFCSYQAKHKRYLRKHLSTHKSSPEATVLKCEMCAYETNYKSDLSRHVLIHPLEKM